MTDRPPAPPASRSAVVVLGMHRSGTSALSGVLSHLGCDLPRDLMVPNPYNPKGYFESNKACVLNDAVLASAGSSWDDWQEFNAGWFGSPKAAEFRDKACAVLAEDFGDSRLFVLKDPRICRLAPLWFDALELAGCRPLVVCTHRNPLDVAASLERREGWPRAYGLLLWLRHVLDAEAASRGRLRYFTSYHALLQNWARVAQDMQTALDVSWPRLSDAAATEIEIFLGDELQHFRQSPDQVTANPLLSAWIRTTFEIMDRWTAGGGEDADHATLDRIRMEFTASAPAFARLIQNGREALRKVVETETALAAARTEGQTLQTGLAERQKVVEQVQAELARLRETRVGADRQVAALADALAAREREAEEAQATLAAARTTAQALQASLAERQKVVEQVQAELARLREARAGADRQVAALVGALAAREQEAGEAQAALAAAQTEVATLHTGLDAAESALQEARHALLNAEHEKDQLRSALAQRSLEAEEGSASLRERDTALDTLRRELGEHQRRVEEARLQQADDQQKIDRLSLELGVTQQARHLIETELERSARNLNLLKSRLGDQMKAALAKTLQDRGKEADDLLRKEEQLRISQQTLSEMTRKQEEDQKALADLRKTLPLLTAERGQDEQNARMIVGMRDRLAVLENEKTAAERKAEALGAALEGRDRQTAAEKERADMLAERLKAREDELGMLARLLAENEEAYRHQIEAAQRAAAAEAEDMVRTQAERQAQLHQEQDRLNRLQNDYDARVAALEARNRDLLSSTSWRITAPLRKVVLMLRRRPTQ